jgi:hypothetical protein
MGWWKSGDDLLSDGPADAVDEGLDELVSRHGKPGWQQFIDALDSALGAHSRLRAVFLDGHPDLRSDPAHAEAPLADLLAGMVQRVVAKYIHYRERKPTLSEILGTFRFCLGPMPEQAIAAPEPVPKLDWLILEASVP